MKTMHLGCLAALVLGVASPAVAVDRHVPAGYATIQAAINASHDGDTVIVADGTSCRHQIADGSGRQALHVARILAMALADRPGDREGALS